MFNKQTFGLIIAVAGGMLLAELLKGFLPKRG